MLTLVHGSLGLDYLVHNILPSNDWWVSMICQGGDGVGIDMDLSPGIRSRIALLWSRILELRDDDSRLLLDALINSSRLYDAINYILETYIDYDATRLYFFMRIMSTLGIWKPIGRGCIDVPLIEPVKSLVTAAILAYNAANGIRGSMILASDFIDEIKDALQEVRGVGNVYIMTNHLPRELGVFDELIITSMAVPQETFGKLIRIGNGNSSEVLITRIGLGIARNNFETAAGSMGNIEMEILRTVNELGFTTLNSLIDMVSQSTGASKDDTTKALIRASNMNLVRIRYLPDGRAVVTPTVAGLRLLTTK